MGISRQQALDCLRSDDLIGIGMEADEVRRRLHPEGVVSYALEGAVSMPDGMCAGGKAGEASHQRLYDEIRNTIDLGSTGLRLVSCLDSDSMPRKIECLEEILRGIRQRFPSLWIEALSPAEIVSLAKGCGLDAREAIARLRDAGLDSIASDDAAVNIGHRFARSTCTLAEWIAVHRAAHGLEMQTVATMRFGAGEAGAGEYVDQRVDLLAAVRQLQQETGGFTAFIPRSLPSRNAAGGWDEPTAVEQLKTLAVARVFLDNIENIQASGVQSLKVLQTGLLFGANDAGSVTPMGANEEDLRRIIRDAGFKPVQRDTPYRTMMLN